MFYNLAYIQNIVGNQYMNLSNISIIFGGKKERLGGV